MYDQIRSKFSFYFFNYYKIIIKYGLTEQKLTQRPVHSPSIHLFYHKSALA